MEYLSIDDNDINTDFLKVIYIYRLVLEHSTIFFKCIFY